MLARVTLLETILKEGRPEVIANDYAKMIGRTLAQNIWAQLGSPAATGVAVTVVGPRSGYRFLM
jgi:hypothetical protein